MRILVTGAAGFLGSHLVDRLIGEGHRVTGIDNLITGSLDNLAHLRNEPRFDFIMQNVVDPIEIAGRVEGIFHLASPASPRDYLRLPIQTLKAGALGTHNALGLAKRTGARILLASTSEVYGDPLVHPQPESYWGNVNPVGPRAVYDEAKRFAEAIVMAYGRSHGVNAGIARIFNTYGPRMRPDDGRVVSTFVTQALQGGPLTIYGDGSQSRSFCYVSDQIDGLYRLFRSTVTQPVNVGNPDEYTIRELASLVISVCGSESTLETRALPVDDPQVRCPDISRASAKLGWKPVVPLRQGLERMVSSFRELQENGALASTPVQGD